MSHARYEEWLAVYEDLDPAKRDEVDRHLQECARCAARLADYRALCRPLRSEPVPGPGSRLRAGFDAAVARVRARDQRLGRRGALSRPGLALGSAAAWAAVAAVAMLVVLSLHLTWRPLARQVGPGGTPSPAQATRVGPGEAGELAGSEWVLMALNGKPPVEGTNITLRFGDTRAEGFAGCNRYGMEYTITSEGKLSAGMLAVTAALCQGPEGVMEQERAYTDALRGLASYQWAGDRLEMRNATGDTVLTFQKREPLAMDPADLVGTEWQLLSVDGQPPIEGSCITIAFGESEIRGQAGCRGYTGTYEAEGDRIRFPRMGMTETEPRCSQALQRQEGEYTTRLGWTTHYRLQGDQLELFTAGGETLLYTRARPLAGQPAVSVARLERVQDLCCPPRFAPDGETYLTISGEGKLLLHTLWAGPAREVPVAPGNGAGAGRPVANAAWTPDGTAIVVSQGAVGPPAPLFLVHPASGAARRLGETYTPWRLTFDARGRLVVATETAYRTLDLASGAWADLAGVASRYTAGVETELAFSPDGRSVAVLEGSQLAIVDLATGRKTPVTSHIHPQWRAAFAWSHDSRQLAYATGARGEWPELWVLGPDGVRRLLTREGDPDRGGAFAGLAWLPGTPYIVYQFLPSGNAATLQAEYQVLSAEGGAPKTLFTNGIGLSLSPDGHLLSFTRDLQGAEETGTWVAVLEYARAPAPAMPTPRPPAITPLATGASIEVGGWSPGGEWLAFWRAGDGAPANPYPAMTLHFYSVRTGQTRECPEFRTQTTSTRPLPLTWQDDAQVVVWDGKTAKRGTPCQGSFQTIAEKGPADAAEAAALSPGGSYRATTVEEPSDGGRIRVTTAFADARTGQPVRAVGYFHRGGLGSLGLGGEWLTDRLFLIRETFDRGPLLVDVQEGRVVEALRQLFAVSQAPSTELGFWAAGKTVAGTDTYHIVLGGVGLESAYPPLRLYHSETGEVEELAFKYSWSPIFSPDGRWLLLDARPRRPRAGTDLVYESQALWVRPVDPAGSSPRLLADGGYPARWSPDWTRVAVAGPGSFFGLPNVTSVYSFPEGRLLSSWATGGYQARPDAWSPDGRWLAMSGNVPGEWKYALFVVEP